VDITGLLNMIDTTTGQITIRLDGDRGDVAIGGNGESGLVSVLDGDGRTRVSLEPLGNGARFRLRDDENQLIAELVAALNVAVFTVGGSGFDGNVVVRNAAGTDAIRLDGRDGEITVHDDDGRPTVLLNGETGDVTLAGADAAEEFEIAASSAAISRGTVVVIDTDGRLRESTRDYDRRVAGVLAGAGKHRPGVILGQHSGETGYWRPVALAGRTYCKLDATSCPIEVGDLLTTAMTPGHAMKATDPQRAFGAVIGKALEPLSDGRGLAPILVALQ
jgi:hypothetical protein